MKKNHMYSKTDKHVREIDNFHEQFHWNREQLPNIVIKAMKTNTRHKIFVKSDENQCKSSSIRENHYRYMKETEHLCIHVYLCKSSARIKKLSDVIVLCQPES